MTLELGRLVIYTKKLDQMIAFYCAHFGYEAKRAPGDRIVELRHPGDGVILLLNPAGEGARQGQAAVKLVFTVADVPAFAAQAARNGLEFGTLHQADGYVFANAKDPSGNPVSISGRLV